MGIYSNLRYLQMIEEPLADFLTQHRGARLRVVCDRRPSFRLIPPELCEYVKWSPQSEIQATQEMDAGLMPLDDSEWTRGKCAAKMLAYLAAGVPAVVSPVGVNADILALGELGLGAVSGEEWFRALKKLYDNRERSREMGRAGREIVEQHYSVRSNAPKLAEIFSVVVSR
jgi:glycosyltransferase involved in cell wall biosynthesis